ncbi:hypothetical protein Tco_0694564 [Tanacetum coccineum]
MDEEVAKQIDLDEMVAKRLAEEEALSEQQKKRKAQVQFESQYYTEEDWDAIRAKLEANAELTKIYGEELHTKTSKKQKINDKYVPVIGEKVAEVKEEEPQQVDSETDKEESVEAMNPTPLATKSNIVVNWKIFQQGQRSVYQIMRANGADTVYMSFGAMIKYFTRRVSYRQYRYYPTCAVHCLTLEASTIYMLADRKYPLSKDACQVMLKMKLLDGTMDEVCYQLLKMIEKQAGIRK